MSNYRMFVVAFPDVRGEGVKQVSMGKRLLLA